jgi:hypothetical protein
MRIGLLTALLLGCSGDTKDTGSDPGSVAQDTDTAVVTCEGTAPVLTELEVGDYGQLYPFEDGEAPALLVAATAEDADSDLHRMNLIVWWDDIIDGTVDTSGVGNEAGYYAMNEETCGTAEATYGILFEVDGDRFAYTTAYEFTAEVYDDAGLVSNRVTASGVTPGEAL